MEEESAADKQRWDLYLAISRGDLERMKTLLEQGCDPNFFDYTSWTPLQRAAKGKHVEMVRCLLAAGADVNAHDADAIGETPLGEVAANCSLEMAKILVEAGADPTISGWMGLTALDRARDRKKPEGREVYGFLVEAAQKFRRA